MPTDARTFALAIDPSAGDEDTRRVDLGTAAAFPELSINGRHISTWTLNRWCTRGVRGVVLDSLLIGNHRTTTRGDVLRFLAALNYKSGGGKLSPKKRSKRVRAGLAHHRI